MTMPIKRGRILEQYHELVGSLLARITCQNDPSPRTRWNAAPCDAPRYGLEDEREPEHDEIDQRLRDRFRMPDVDDALIDRDSRTEREDQKRDHEAPEIELAAVAEGMDLVRAAGRNAVWP